MFAPGTEQGTLPFASQVEGVVADYNLTLGHLIGVIAEFFERLGMSDVKFKPAYNPYTEPSMEIFAYHPDLKKEVEVGNSGLLVLITRNLCDVMWCIVA